MVALSSLFNNYQLTAGRIAYSARQVAAAARRLGDEEVATEAAAVVEAAQLALSLERRWQSGQLDATSRGGGEAVPLDNRVDRLVGAVHTMLQTYVTAADREDQHRVAAEQIIRAAYPQGASAITNRSFEDQASAVDLLLEQLRGDLAEPAAVLSLEPMVGKLETAHNEFKAVLTTPKRERVEFGEVRAARDGAREGLAQVMALIAGKYRRSEDTGTRDTLLGPILDQNRRVADAFRRRRAVADVDPETGTELEPSSEELSLSPAEA